ncbi:hypothetical protein C9J85_13310 [Haloferax sp. wsp5]|nr:hypothetical protein C9J85_13310 [Haloferax sp. wsp5]
MTAATIVSGAVAGRAKLRAYITYTFLLAAVIYPVVTGLTWAVTSISVRGADGRERRRPDQGGRYRRSARPRSRSRWQR